MWELDYKEGWAPKNWCFQTVVLKKTIESPLDSKEIKPINLKGKQPWILMGRTDAEAEAPILWPPDGKTQLIWKTLMPGKIEGRRRRWQPRMRWLAIIFDTMHMSLSKLQEIVQDKKPGMLQSLGSQNQIWLIAWTKTVKKISNKIEIDFFYLLANFNSIECYFISLWLLVLNLLIDYFDQPKIVSRHHSI